jgi:hypothetical protein
MRKNLLMILGAGAAVAFALPTFVLSMPKRAEGLYVPTIYVPGQTCEMPVKLDDLTSINGLRRLEGIHVALVGQTTRGRLWQDGLSFEPRNHNDSWDKISVVAHQDAGRSMPYAYLTVRLPNSDMWRGVQATLVADARLVYPAEITAADGTRAYEDRTVPIKREFSFRVATVEEERDAADRKAKWQAEDSRWNAEFQRWQTTNTICYAAGGILVAALLVTLVAGRKRPGKS